MAMRILLFLWCALLLPAQDIFDAVRGGDLAKVREWVEKDPGLVHARNARQSTPLIIAASLDKLEIARYLIEKGADLGAVNVNEYTPLSIAGILVARLLVEKGADVNFINPHGFSVLKTLFEDGKREVAEFVLDHGARFPDFKSPDGIRTLIFAMKAGSVKYLEMGLSRGIDLFYENNAHNTLLHFAAESPSVELMEKLLALGLDAGKVSLSGWTALHVAAYSGNDEQVTALIRRGVDINQRTVDGRTAYNLAVEAKHTVLVDHLVILGADRGSQRFPKLQGDYLGQPKPGKKAVPFAPGIVNFKPLLHGTTTFSPDGNEAYWSFQGAPSLYCSKRVNGQWIRPESLPDHRGDYYPFLTPDGKKLYFVRVKQIETGYHSYICAMDRTDGGWSVPYELPEIVNATPGISMLFSLDRIGNLYFGAAPFSSINNARVWVSEYRQGVYAKPTILPGYEEVRAINPFIAPDGSYLIFKSDAFKILFRKKDGGWTQERNIEDIVGSVPGSAFPMVSPDGKYFFFSTNECQYWADASFIEELRKEVLKGE